jgi:hypothetical protein
MLGDGRAASTSSSIPHSHPPATDELRAWWDATEAALRRVDGAVRFARIAPRARLRGTALGFAIAGGYAECAARAGCRNLPPGAVNRDMVRHRGGAARHAAGRIRTALERRPGRGGRGGTERLSGRKEVGDAATAAIVAARDSRPIGEEGGKRTGCGGARARGRARRLTLRATSALDSCRETPARRGRCSAGSGGDRRRRAARATATTRT